MMNNLVLTTKTPSRNIEYTARVEICEPLSLMKYLDVSYFNECCKTGCPNYGLKWSCPPYAPQYQKYVSKYRYLIVLLLKADMTQFSYIKNDYLKIKAANSILKSRLDKTLRYFKNSDTNYISSGSCRMCKPCKKKKGMACAHPELMSYSFEALGINVDGLIQDLFGIELIWYSKGDLPKYTCVVGGLLCNGEIKCDELFKILNNCR